MRAAIDFGISNIDAIAEIDGALHRWTLPSNGAPNESSVRQILAAGGISLESLPALTVTGGRHTALPPRISATEIVAIAEVTAIARGGQLLAEAGSPDTGTPVLVISAGSGTAIVTARDGQYTHVTGTGVGGGTLLGLGRLLLGTIDVALIDAMASRGDANGVDLALRDVVSGPIGALPPDATAVNFGRLARTHDDPAPDDLAAALMTLVGQVIAITAINAARAERITRLVLVGHMADLHSFRAVIALVGEYYGTEIIVPAHAGHGTVLGALMSA